jgi:AcrR family transcriptional regulator
MAAEQIATTSSPGSTTRDRIIDAARTLFLNEGYERVTMRRIAEAVGYTPTTIYVHFRDKEALIRELAERDFLALAGRFMAIAMVADPMERLRQVGIAYAEFGLQHPHHYRLMFMEPTPECATELENVVERGNPQQDAYAFLTWTIQGCIDAGRLRPEYTDVEATAQLVWGAMHGVVSLHVARGNDPWITWKPAMETVTLLIDTLARGLAAE